MRTLFVQYKLRRRHEDVICSGNYIVTVNGNGLDPLVEMKWDRQSSYSVKAHGICKGTNYQKIKKLLSERSAKAELLSANILIKILF